MDTTRCERFTINRNPGRNTSIVAAGEGVGGIVVVVGTKVVMVAAAVVIVAAVVVFRAVVVAGGK